MNIHHLELFYYVARHGGISRAVRHMPYGIQQPAVSSQILLLEEDLGVKLFDRQPFQLTAEGRELFDFVSPFFENLESVRTRMRQGHAPLLRVGASELVLRKHVPAVLQRVRQHHPQVRVSLRTGLQAQLEAWLLERQIDLAVTSLETRPAARLQFQRLLELPLVLLVPRKSKIKSAAELWARDRIEEPLICLPPTETLSRLFQKGLKQRKVDWLPALETTSYELITDYVANGYGLGVNVNLPDIVANAKVRALPLDGFDPVVIAALWCGQPTVFLQSVLDEIKLYAEEARPRG